MQVIFGGTFDPVHSGHLNMATSALSQLQAEHLYFMPCAIPVHKARPGVADAHRIAMLKLAIAEHPEFLLDTRELERTEPSYSLLSMQEWRKDRPTEPLVFLLGMDSFNQLHRWYHWQQLVALCHIVVYQRPGDVFAPSAELQAYLAAAEVTEPNQLHQQAGGLCYFMAGPTFDVSSSQIRALLQQGRRNELALPTAVLSYITEHQLYAGETGFPC
ncbi:nicotinate-nucleotide adenylyltransferase [Pseudoalteromonas fenneropenaei]|uniref:Probable nicotinate-nucleotide adenylyltransferase n=1 Tax=Pseudoalteromonas fenneropenaei TaxID=1737459 RepID=A0ABV7CM78_9GAMM